MNRSPSLCRPLLLTLVIFAMADSRAAFAMPSPIVPQSDSTPSSPVTTSLSSEQIRDTSQRIMQQHDYRSVRRRILENRAIPKPVETGEGFLQRTLRKIGASIGDFFDWIFTGMFSSPRPRIAPRPTPSPSPTSSTEFDFSFGRLFLILALAALVAVIAWMFAGILKASDGRRKLDNEDLFGDEEDLSNLSVPPGEFAASTYESRALKLAAEGRFQPAIRELLLGSMSWVERAGMIRFRKGLTNRDYIRAVWRDEPKRFAFGKTALEFERIYFGRRTATQQMFDTCLQAFQGAFREETTTQTV